MYQRSWFGIIKSRHYNSEAELKWFLIIDKGVEGNGSNILRLTRHHISSFVELPSRRQQDHHGMVTFRNVSLGPAQQRLEELGLWCWSDGSACCSNRSGFRGNSVCRVHHIVVGGCRRKIRGSRCCGRTYQICATWLAGLVFQNKQKDITDEVPSCSRPVKGLEWKGALRCEKK